MTKRGAEIVFLIGFLIMSLLLFKSSARFPEVVQHSTASYVRFLALCLGGLSIIEILLWVKNRSTAKSKMLDLTSAPFRFWSLLVLMFAYAMLLEPLGFYLASLLFLPITMVILGARKKLQIILTTGGVLVFVYIVFAELLSVPLPESTFF
ncbi:tripartite tricarboxylate transporter TctB family protein [Desulforhopalus sp. IMCC35007]|uniref:tripartite tricarboxylate transporter TctB family protein n=1 Tax=Desulforhopalus sp. IMCC35007 TaxID=2569543 RepID=UPI0010AEA1AE|nr:tripartite tricarboxylate transporter TctB family protein [Desulforhopalus sp. IMCC35007]TKB09268.1 tripartite tricarboxylate transporter TctB family protein [Desulforhopalus sp. IMCC35007]